MKGKGPSHPKTSISATQKTKFCRLRDELLQELQFLSKVNLFRKVYNDPPHIVELKEQIENLKQIINKQEQQISAPYPEHPKSTYNKLQEIKAQYALLYKQRVVTCPDHKIDRDQQSETKQLLDSITYILKTANFLPLLKDKQSTLMMSSCRSEDFGYEMQLHQYEEYIKECQRLSQNICKIREEIKKVDGSMRENKNSKQEI